MAHFIGLFGAIEEAQNALSCKNGLGDRQIGKLTTATSHILVKFFAVACKVCLPISLAVRRILFYSVWLAGITVEVAVKH